MIFSIWYRVKTRIASSNFEKVGKIENVVKKLTQGVFSRILPIPWPWERRGVKRPFFWGDWRRPTHGVRVSPSSFDNQI
ncbi:MAG: hypothetical protein ACLFTV_17540, partial [Desulfococcaceae bacterium]